jgi:hypothetical protein
LPLALHPVVGGGHAVGCGDASPLAGEMGTGGGLVGHFCACHVVGKGIPSHSYNYSPWSVKAARVLPLDTPGLAVRPKVMLRWVVVTISPGVYLFWVAWLRREDGSRLD